MLRPGSGEEFYTANRQVYGARKMHAEYETNHYSQNPSAPEADARELSLH